MGKEASDGEQKGGEGGGVVKSLVVVHEHQGATACRISLVVVVNTW